MKKLIILFLTIIITTGLFAQTILLEANSFEASRVFLSYEKLEEQKVIKVLADTTI